MKYTSIRRHAVGVMSVGLLVGALALLLGLDGNQSRMFGALCLRAGLTMGVIWLALPQLIVLSERFPPRLMIAISLGAVIVVWRPKMFPIVLVAVLAIGLLEFAGRFLAPAAGKKRKNR